MKGTFEGRLAFRHYYYTTTKIAWREIPRGGVIGRKVVDEPNLVGVLFLSLMTTSKHEGSPQQCIYINKSTKLFEGLLYASFLSSSQGRRHHLSPMEGESETRAMRQW